MSHHLPPVPARFRWLPVLGWALVLAVLATGGWSGWREYDYRAAVREVRAAGFRYFESPTPFDAIRADWRAAFRRATWLEHERRLDLPIGTDLAPLRPLLLRLDPTCLQAWRSANVDALRGLTRLRWLDLDGAEVKDLAPLAGLTQLQTLNLYGCTGITDLTPLAGLAQLRILNLRGCTGVTDLTPLAGLTQLQELYLQGCAGIADLASLAGLAQLQGLWLDGCTGVADLAPLAGLTQLQGIYLRGCTGVADFAPLARLARLQSLDLGGCTGVANLAPLIGLKQLTFLNLTACTGLSAEAVAAFQAQHPTIYVESP